MANAYTMKEKLQRVRKALELRPGLAAATYSGRCTLAEGSVATYEESGVRILLDVPYEVGGTNEAPSPGKMMRAALAGCIAIGIKMEAAVSDVQIDQVSVDLEADSDDRADFGIHDTPPGYSQFRLRVAVTSPSPEAMVRGVVARSLAQSPVLDAIHKAQDLTLETTISAPAAAAE